MASREEQLTRAAHGAATPVYMTTYSEQREYYKDKYGQRGYIGAMASAYAGTTDKKSLEYKAARRSIERIEKGQYKGFGKTSQYRAKVPEVGKQLPPTSYTPKQSEIKVKVTGKQSDGHGGTRDRTVEVSLSGPSAYAFVNSPQYTDVWDAYGVDEDLFESGDYELEVETVTVS